MASIFAWLKNFKEIWLRENIPNDHQLISVIRQKVVELENLIGSQSSINEEEFNRAKLLNDVSSDSDGETETNRQSSSQSQIQLENSLPTPPDIVQSMIDDDPDEHQAKTTLLNQSESSESSQEELEQRPVIFLKRLSSKDVERFYVSDEKNQSETSSSSDDEFSIRTRFHSPVERKSCASSSPKKSSNRKRSKQHEVIINCDPNRFSAAGSPQSASIENHSDHEITTTNPEITPKTSPKPLTDIEEPMQIDFDTDESNYRMDGEESQHHEPDQDENQQPTTTTVSSYNHLLAMDSSDSDRELQTKKRFLRSSSSGSSSSVGSSSQSSKPKRKILKRRVSIQNSTSSDDQSFSSETEEVNLESPKENESKNRPISKEKQNGRKNIRKIIDDKELDAQTKRAIAAEQERRLRIAEKQKTYNNSLLDRSTDCSMTNGDSIDETARPRFVLELDKTTNEPLIEVSPKLAEHLKEHQIDGVRFLWNNLFESIEAIDKKKPSSNGCILAHCMGLGKTLQVITFLHTIFSYQKFTRVQTALVLCPINAALNWTNEFDYWLKDIDPPLDHYQLATVKTNLRINYLSSWYKNGGVLVMGYEIYRRLANGLGIQKKDAKLEAYRCLVDPGPDVIIADEGHILKNAQTALAKCLSNVRTSRRVVLTGTPLQNNLIEYYCMVSFIKPQLLGTQQEYINRFVNPIQNGQHRDSNEEDVRLMKRRACVLHELLTGFVDRKDYSLLREYLPPKFEYIIKIRLSDLQWTLYENYLKQEYRFGQSNSTLKRDFRSARLFADYQFLQRIWTHPFLLFPHFIDCWKRKLIKGDENIIDENEIEEMFNEIDGNGKKKKKSCGFLIDNIDKKVEVHRHRSASSSSSTLTIDSADDDDVEIVKTYATRQRTSLNENENTTSTENDEPWLDDMRQQYWFKFLENLPSANRFDIEMSGKFLIFKAILEKSAEIGDKVLLFSRSLFTLDHIEDFLKCLHQQSASESNSLMPVQWIRDQDYFRIDGQTDVTTRKRYAKSFNDLENDRARLLLISTVAGGIGINLTGSNRVIIFDASWNPSHDTQAIFRSYRFGQKKPVYIYRFLAYGTMEEKIYQRQVVKQSLSQRVIDDHQLDRHFSQNDIKELYKFRAEKLPDPQPIASLIADNSGNFPYPIPTDHLLLDLLYEHHRWIHSYHSHDSLLENKLDEGLTADERKRALEEYENLKRMPENRYLVLQRLQQQQQQMNAQIAQQQQQMNATAARQQFQNRLNEFLATVTAVGPMRRPLMPRTTQSTTSSTAIRPTAQPPPQQRPPPPPSTTTTAAAATTTTTDEINTRNEELIYLESDDETGPT